MLASKLCRIPITSFVSGIGRPLNKPQLCIKTRVQQMSMESRSGTSRRAARSKLVEKVAAPAGETGKPHLQISSARDNDSELFYYESILQIRLVCFYLLQPFTVKYSIN